MRPWDYKSSEKLSKESECPNTTLWSRFVIPTFDARMDRILRTLFLVTSFSIFAHYSVQYCVFYFRRESGCMRKLPFIVSWPWGSIQSFVKTCRSSTSLHYIIVQIAIIVLCNQLKISPPSVFLPLTVLLAMRRPRSKCARSQSWLDSCRQGLNMPQTRTASHRKLIVASWAVVYFITIMIFKRF